jgi:hypothetical protein
MKASQTVSSASKHIATQGSAKAVAVEPDPGGGAAVAAAAVSLLAQCAALVERLDDGAYTATSTTIRGGTIGKHFRHVLDHFRAAVGCHADGGCIDYDHRDRDVPMETDRRLAMDSIDSLAAGLRRIDDRGLSSAVRVRVMVSADGATAELRSTLARELAFAAHHAVHHLAMIRAIASEFGQELPEDLGRAPSTLNHERRLAGAGPAGE